jgi:hypothetical protein
MSLRGDLRTMQLPDVLQWVATGQKTGTLHVERRSIQKRIILREGNIFSSWSNDPRESLGQFLIRLRLVTEEQLFRALLAQEEKGRLLGSILVADGVLGEDDLKRALKAKAEETVFDLFLWPSGQFEFREGEFPDDILITFESSVTPVILEGIRRVDEWQRIKSVFPSMETTVKVKGPPPAGADAAEKQLLGLAAAGKSLAEISLELRRSEFETASLVYEMHGRGVVVAGEVRAESQARDPVGAIQGLLTLAYKRLQEKRYDAALKAYEEVLALDRLNQHAKKGPDRGDGGPPARAPAPHDPARQGAGTRGRLRHAHQAEPRPAGRLRDLPRQRPVGHPVDPEALPDGGGRDAADLRAPAGSKTDQARGVDGLRSSCRGRA